MDYITILGKTPSTTDRAILKKCSDELKAIFNKWSNNGGWITTPKGGYHE